MELFTHDDLRTLLAEQDGPCVSIYMATCPGGGGKADVGRWRQNLERVHELLGQQGLRDSDVTALLAPTRSLLEDHIFWKHSSQGLAYFLNPRLARPYRLPIRFDTLVAVGPSFNVKPLLPVLADNGRFFVLALSQNGLRLMQGTRFSVADVQLGMLHGLPANLADTLKFDEKIEPLTFHTRPVGKSSWSAIFSGHGVGIDDHKDDLLRYFQEIDRGLHPLLKEETAPLVLAAVESLWPIYRKANSYAHLVENGIAGNPDRLSSNELHALAWKIVEPIFARARKDAIDLYHRLEGTGRTTHALEEVLLAACQGNIHTLFIALDRSVWGRCAADNMPVEIRAEPHRGDEDLLNRAAVEALRHHRRVYALSEAEMPGGGAAAAIFSLPLAKHK